MALSSGSSPDDMGLVQFRIERGAQAEATDGPIGSVEQIVVDRDTGELRALVVRAADGSSEFELPASSIQRATGDHVYLDVSRQELARNPSLAQPYDPTQYVPVYEGPIAQPAATRIAHDTDRPVVTNVETDAAQVVAPAILAEPAVSPAPQRATSAAASMRAAEEGAAREQAEQQLYRTGALYPPAERPSAQASQEPKPPAPETSEVPAPTPAAASAPSSELTDMHGVPVRHEGLLGEPPPGLREEQERITLNLAALAGLIAGGLAAGIGVGALIALSRHRQRARPSRAIKRATSNVTSAVTGAAASAQDALRQLAASVQPAASDLAEKASVAAANAAPSVRAAGKGARTAPGRRGNRAGWFLRGAGVGAALAILYAPLPGPIMRARLAHTIERLANTRRSA